MVVECYASGTFPISNKKFISLFENYFHQKIGIKVSQAFKGNIDAKYENNICFENLVNGSDENHMAAFWKLKYLLGKYSDLKLVS